MIWDKDRKKRNFMTDAEKNKQYQSGEQEKKLNDYCDRQSCDKNKEEE